MSEKNTISTEPQPVVFNDKPMLLGTWVQQAFPGEDPLADFHIHTGEVHIPRVGGSRKLPLPQDLVVVKVLVPTETIQGYVHAYYLWYIGKKDSPYMEQLSKNETARYLSANRTMRQLNNTEEGQFKQNQNNGIPGTLYGALGTA